MIAEEGMPLLLIQPLQPVMFADPHESDFYRREATAESLTLTCLAANCTM